MACSVKTRHRTFIGGMVREGRAWYVFSEVGTTAAKETVSKRLICEGAGADTDLSSGRCTARRLRDVPRGIGISGVFGQNGKNGEAYPTVRTMSRIRSMARRVCGMRNLARHGRRCSIGVERQALFERWE